MAYNPSELHLMVDVGNGLNIWKYNSAADADATVIAAGFISDAQSRGMNVGDTVIVAVFTTAAFTTLSTHTVHAASVVASTGATLV